MYSDAQRYRLGVNHHQIPVNRPKGMKKEDYHPFHRDGQMRVDGNMGRCDFREDDSDYFTQPGLLYNAMTEDQKQVLCENTARAMGDSTYQIKHRWINLCYQADEDYGKRLAKSLDIDIEDVDLDLLKRDSEEGNFKANNARPELDKPSKDLEEKDWDEIKTDYDPKKFIDPEDDSYLL